MMALPQRADVGQRIRHYRIRSGRTQAAVAGLCGITEDYLSRIERSSKFPPHFSFSGSPTNSA
ncbi:helix-turn-helix domain-containing protein [Streptomyces sp. NPDC048644]|uniref:helix-turn-helix domain-containing protein n=1 Tax=Streptomyces sp. NPDC048644 TaxID=3365582 RepID=UPI00371712DC